MRYFDTHCHLQDERIAEHLDGIIDRARAASVMRMQSLGTSEDDWARMQAMSEKYAEIAIGFGLHPWFIQKRSVHWIDTLKSLLLQYPNAVVGEIGLDHALNYRNDAEQNTVFSAQLRLARKIDRPVSIHCRKAWGDLLRILDAEGGVPGGGAIHSYSGPPDLVPQLEKYNLSISFSCSVIYERNHRAHAAVMAVSEGRLLVESDAPDISPPDVAPGHNEPANVPIVVRKIAQLRNASEEDLAEKIFVNSAKIF